MDVDRRLASIVASYSGVWFFFRWLSRPLVPELFFSAPGLVRLYVKSFSHCWVNAGNHLEAGNSVVTVYSMVLSFRQAAQAPRCPATLATSSDPFARQGQALLHCQLLIVAVLMVKLVQCCFLLRK